MKDAICVPVQAVLQMDFMSWSRHNFLFLVPIFVAVFDLYILLYCIPMDLSPTVMLKACLL